MNSNPSGDTTLEGSKLMSHWVFLCQRVAVGVPRLLCGQLVDIGLP